MPRSEDHPDNPHRNMWDVLNRGPAAHPGHQMYLRHVDPSFDKAAQDALNPKPVPSVYCPVSNTHCTDCHKFCCKMLDGAKPQEVKMDNKTLVKNLEFWLRFIETGIPFNKQAFDLLKKDIKLAVEVIADVDRYHTSVKEMMDGRVKEALDEMDWAHIEERERRIDREVLDAYNRRQREKQHVDPTQGPTGARGTTEFKATPYDSATWTGRDRANNQERPDGGAPAQQQNEDPRAVWICPITRKHCGVCIGEENCRVGRSQ